MKLHGKALTPTGRHENWWHVGDNKRDPRVRNYGDEEIFEYIVDHNLTRSPELARKVAIDLNADLYDWNDGTDIETTWDELIRAAVKQEKERLDV